MARNSWTVDYGQLVVHKTMINGYVAVFWNCTIFVVFPMKTWMGRVRLREILRVDSGKNLYNFARLLYLFQMLCTLQAVFRIQVYSGLSCFPVGLVSALFFHVTLNSLNCRNHTIWKMSSVSDFWHWMMPTAGESSGWYLLWKANCSKLWSWSGKENSILTGTSHSLLPEAWSVYWNHYLHLAWLKMWMAIKWSQPFIST